MFTDNIQTVNLDGISDFERIDAELRALIVTIIGTLPGSRAFGIEDYVDENAYDVQNELAAAIDEGCERYMPEISVESIEFESDVDGEMATVIYVEERDED